MIDRAMNENEKGGEDELRERIASLLRANDQALKKQITDEEVRTLKAAAGRLDRMLKAAVEADGQALKSAAARLDQLLEHMVSGKDVSRGLKRRQDWKKRKSEDG